MKIHFIAIGGSAMHNLAIALYKKNYIVTGSDDEIFEPSKSNLSKYNLLPEQFGWFESKITADLDAVILGMHAKEDNIELLKAKELNLKIFSYPEYIYEQCKDKIRVVIGGSHGKTTITSMIIHVLNYNNINCDYLVGAQLEGFDTMVKLSDDAKYAIIEGDEYLSSTLDKRPKFHLYRPNIAAISGIAWDHANVFPTFNKYIEQFKIFSSLIEKNGSFIYFNKDKELQIIAGEMRSDVKLLPYSTHPHEIKNNITYLETKNDSIPLEIFGDHNLQNINAAKMVCKQLSVNENQFYSAIRNFKGASKRLQLLNKNDKTSVFLDFAHSPSKLKATIEAVKQQFPDRKLIACLELHTFSSLKKAFITQYDGTTLKADKAYIYFNYKTIDQKSLRRFSKKFVAKCFGGENIKVISDPVFLEKKLLSTNWENKNLLIMSSGNFSGMDFINISNKIVNHLD
jgi:UDP-N-acetylmuramate: L-alanyl-gamma-D-glutamyl-meso-diaminopimelate ligase